MGLDKVIINPPKVTPSGAHSKKRQARPSENGREKKGVVIVLHKFFIHFGPKKFESEECESDEFRYIYLIDFCRKFIPPEICAFDIFAEDDFEVDNEEHNSNHDSDVEDEIFVEKEVETREDIPPSHENETNPEKEFFSMGPEGDGDIEDSSSEEEYFDDELFEENEIPTEQTQGNDDVDNFDAGSDDSYDPVENDDEKSATRRKKTFDEVGRVEAVKFCPELDGSIIFKVGQIFDDVYAFRGFLRDYGVIGGYNFNRVKNDPDRVTAECKGEGCNWRIHASTMPHCDTFMMKTLKGEHSCVHP
ncbi:hypothetical protein ACFE04_019154 [Oxalis oulophora]